MTPSSVARWPWTLLLTGILLTCIFCALLFIAAHANPYGYNLVCADRVFAVTRRELEHYRKTGQCKAVAIHGRDVTCVL